MAGLDGSRSVNKNSRNLRQHIRSRAGEVVDERPTVMKEVELRNQAGSSLESAAAQPPEEGKYLHGGIFCNESLLSSPLLRHGTSRPGFNTSTRFYSKKNKTWWCAPANVNAKSAPRRGSPKGKMIAAQTIITSTDRR